MILSRLFASVILLSMLCAACAETEKEPIDSEQAPAVPSTENKITAAKAAPDLTASQPLSDSSNLRKTIPKKVIPIQVIPPDPVPDPVPGPEPWPDPYPPGYWEPIDPPMPVEPEPIVPLEPVFIAEVEASFPGGQAEMMKFIKNNIKISEYDLEIGCQGKIYVRMVVTTEGKISKPEVVKGVNGCPGLSKSALDVVALMPDWTPASNNGHKVSSYVTFPIVIKYE
jgi:hypothetical protein